MSGMRLYVVIILSFFLQACNIGQEVDAIAETSGGKPIWIYTHINVVSEGDKLDSYYYFGQINESLYEKISNNRIRSGFILLRNVRYWSDQDTIVAYEDEIDDGNLMFRIEDIQRIRRAKSEPVIGFKYAEESEPDVSS